LRLEHSLGNLFRLLPLGQLQFIPSNLQITVLGSPTKQALLSAVKKSWRHLDALVRIYAVEFLFVT
jgi:hypothetical protein